MATSSRSVLRDAKYQSASDEGVLPALLGTQGEIWLAARTDGKAGAGTKSDPFDASTAAKYTTLLTTYNLNYVFMYYPDEFLTLGWEFGLRKTANTGCKHYAAFGGGVIKLASIGTGPGLGTIFGCSYNERADGFEVEGLTLNCDAENQPKWAAGASRFVQGITVRGSNIKVRSTKVTGFGTNSAGTECFPFFIASDAATGDFSNNLSEDCIVTDPATGNQDGCSMITMGTFFDGATGENNVARNNLVDVTGNDFTYSNGPHARFVTGNFVKGCSAGFYTEPVGDWHNESYLFGNRYVNCTVPIYGSAHVGSTHPGIYALGNKMVDCGTITLGSDDTNPHWRYFVAKDNLWIKSDGTVSTDRTFFILSTTNVNISDNVADSSHASAVYLQDCTNAVVGENRATDGTLLTYSLNGSGTTQKAMLSASAGGDASTNTSTSVDSEIVAFSGTGGKTLKRLNALTGVPKLAAGVVSIATLGTDYLSIASNLPAANLTGTIATARLGSGTADASTFLRGDSTWVAGAGTATIEVTSDLLKGDGAGNAEAATPGTDYQAPSTALTRLLAGVSAIGASAIDWSLSTKFSKTLAANTTFTFSSDTDGYDILVAVTNTASNYSVTWPAGIKWSGGVAPTQTIGAFTDVYGFAKIGATIYGARIANYS